MLRILIADDHISVQFGLKMLVEETLGKCQVDFSSSGKDVSEKLKETRYDMLITDLNMPDSNPVRLVPDALSLQPKLRILILSVNPEAVFARRLLAAGAYGYLQKDASAEELLLAIRSIGLGRKFLSTTQMQNLDILMQGEEPEDNPFSRLSSREMEVTLLLLRGFGPLEVSNLLRISQSTASTLKARLFEKLGIQNIVGLTELARLHGLVDGYKGGLP